jgi:ribosomal protein L16/L10AE
MQLDGKSSRERLEAKLVQSGCLTRCSIPGINQTEKARVILRWHVNRHERIKIRFFPH